MKTHHPLPARGWAAFAFLLALILLVPRLRAADADPPPKISYQGYLVDANGVPLGNTAPRNYDVEFRIYDAATAGVVKWGEQQTLTVDKGYFSVLLGEGSSLTGVGHDLPAAFTGNNASDRFIGITVKNLGGTSVEIAPRLQLLTSPYAFEAKTARALLDNNGTNVVIVSAGQVGIGKTPASKLDVNGTVTATKFIGDGSTMTTLNATNLTAGTLDAARIPSLDAAKITTGTLDTNRIPSLDTSKITTGTLADARLSSNIPLKNATTTTFTGSITAASFSGNGTIPLGGIIMWSGSTVPTGWALCNGKTVNGQVTPDLRDRFIVGSGNAYAVKATGGTASQTLTLDQIPAHSHDYYYLAFKVNTYAAVDNGDVNFYIPWNLAPGSGVFSTKPAGGGQPFDNRPPYYALAFIMRVY